MLQSLSPSEPYLIASRSGRILQVSSAFVNLVGLDPSGRNLNDILDDDTVSGLILSVSDTEVYLFDTLVGSCYCSCGAQLSGKNRIVLVFKLLEDRRNQTENLELIRYISRRINTGVDDLTIALRALSHSTGMSRERAIGLLNKSMLNLIRVSRNAAAKADYADGGIALLPRTGNLTEDLASVCRRSIRLGEPYYDISMECTAPETCCVYDASAVQRVVLNLIHHALSHSPLPRPRLHIRISRAEDQLLLQLHSAGSTVHTYDPALGPGGKPLYGEDLELDVASMLLRSIRGNLVSSYNSEGGWICRAAFPIVPEKPDHVFSSMVIDWYGGRDNVAVELSGILPVEAYMTECEPGQA